MTRLFHAGLLMLCLGMCNSGFASDIVEMNKRLGAGVNLGNALEAPKEGDWDVVLQEDYFKLIKDAGFDSIRIPVRWSTHADAQAPYAIDSKFMDRVDWAVKLGLKNDLAVVLNMHHYEEMFTDPDNHAPRFMEMWRQIADHFKNEPETLYFELLNEPHDKLDVPKWNEVLTGALGVVRKTNPNRVVIIGPGGWNNFNSLAGLRLPENDRNIIVTFHYYDPMAFTHQGASWVGPQAQQWLGTQWAGTQEQKEKVTADFAVVQRWAKEHNRPIYLGEYGAYEKADIESRVRWTGFIAGLSSQCGFSYAYWEFCSGFGLYDAQKKQWKELLLKAALEKNKP